MTHEADMRPCHHAVTILGLLSLLGCNPAPPIAPTDAGQAGGDAMAPSPPNSAPPRPRPPDPEPVPDRGPEPEPEPEPDFGPTPPGPPDPRPPVEPPDAPFAEYLADGLGRHLGRYQAIDEGALEGVRWHRFPIFGLVGPACRTGTPFGVFTRDGRPADDGGRDLLIYLQPGGACWSEQCDSIWRIEPTLPALDIVDPDDPYNPFADWDLLYVPACDGALFVGDVDVDADGDGFAERRQRGLANLSAALDLGRAYYGDAERVAIVGSSSGGYGALAAAPLARSLFPTAEIMVVQDAGIGQGRGEADPEFVRRLLGELRATDLIPGDCPDCVDDGHLYRLVDWLLRTDPSLRIAAITAVHDFILGNYFLQIGTDAYARDVIAQTTALAEAWPGRYGSYIYAGSTHTLLVGELSGGAGFTVDDIFGVSRLRDTVVDGVPAAWWLRWFVDDDRHFAPVIDAP